MRQIVAQADLNDMEEETASLVFSASVVTAAKLMGLSDVLDVVYTTHDDGVQSIAITAAESVGEDNPVIDKLLDVSLGFFSMTTRCEEYSLQTKH